MGDLAWDVRWAKVTRKLYDSKAAIFQSILKPIEGIIISLIWFKANYMGDLRSMFDQQ
jgi:hypothetical protein